MSTITSRGANVVVTGYGANDITANLMAPGLIQSCITNAGVVVGEPTFTTANDTGGLITSGGNGTVTLDNSASHLQANGEIWFGENNGTGQLNLSVGSITSSSWVAVGRDNGTGIVTMTGGTWTKLNGGSSFIIGASVLER